VLFHQRRQHRLHALVEPALLSIGLIAQRAERSIGRDLLRRERSGDEEGEKEAHVWMLDAG